MLKLGDRSRHYARNPRWSRLVISIQLCTLGSDMPLSYVHSGWWSRSRAICPPAGWRLLRKNHSLLPLSAVLQVMPLAIPINKHAMSGLWTDSLQPNITMERKEVKANKPTRLPTMTFSAVQLFPPEDKVG